MLGPYVFPYSCHGRRGPMTSPSGFPDACAAGRVFAHLRCETGENSACSACIGETRKEASHLGGLLCWMERSKVGVCYTHRNIYICSFAKYIYKLIWWIKYANIKNKAYHQINTKTSHIAYSKSTIKHNQSDVISL